VVRLTVKQSFCQPVQWGMYTSKYRGWSIQRFLVAGYYSLVCSLLNLIMRTVHTNARKDFIPNVLRIALKMDASAYTFIPEFTRNKCCLCCISCSLSHFLYIYIYIYIYIQTYSYIYASLNDGDAFWEMRRQAISSLCELHRVWLHKPR